jgi:DNA-directed RNA polymerase specialized sigma24 family protein
MDREVAERPVNPPGHGLFATTHWSVVLAAGDPASPNAGAALEALCRTYWYPLYAYVRRRGYGHEDAQDLTQGFLVQLLARRSFARVARNKGRFRSFLLAALNFYLADERDRAGAQKRGGGRPVLPFDGQAAEQRYGAQAVEARSPDKLFEHQWAMALLDRVLARLEQEFRDEGKAEAFDQLRGFIVAGMSDVPYAQVGRKLGITAGGVKKAVYRMRRRYQLLFREEIAQTVADPAEVEDELRHLCQVMAG